MLHLSKRNKFNARRVVYDGFTFDSVKESKRYWALKSLLTYGQITNLRVHPRYPLTLAGHRFQTPTGLGADIVLDFEYIENGVKVYEDVKGKDNEVSRLKRQIFEFENGVKVRII